MRWPWGSKEERAPVSAAVAPLAVQNPEYMAQKSFSFLRASSGYAGGRGLVYGNATSTDRQNNSIVMACALWAGRNIQQAPVATYQETGEGWEIVPGHPAAMVIRKPQGMISPDERTKFNGRQLLSSILMSAMLTGDAYVFKVRGSRGQVIGLDYFPAHTVNIVTRPNDSRMVERYEVNQTNGVLRVDPRDMVTFPLFGLDEDFPYKGRDPLRATARQIITDNKIGQYSESIMDSPNPRLALSPRTEESELSQEEATEIQKITSESLGGKNAGRTMVPTFAAEITPFGFSPDQMAISVINQLPETRICAIYGIPPTAIQLQAGLEHSTYSNMKEAREAATEEFLVPMWTAMAEIWTEQVLPEIDPNKNLEIRYNLSEVRPLQEDKDALHKRTRDDFTANLIDRKTARIETGREASPGDENVYAYMLKPVMSPLGLPGGPEDAEKARQAAENGGK